MLMWKYGELKARLIIPCVISAVTASIVTYIICALL